MHRSGFKQIPQYQAGPSSFLTLSTSSFYCLCLEGPSAQGWGVPWRQAPFRNPLTSRVCAQMSEPGRQDGTVPNASAYPAGIQGALEVSSGAEPAVGHRNKRPVCVLRLLSAQVRRKGAVPGTCAHTGMRR